VVQFANKKDQKSKSLGNYKIILRQSELTHIDGLFALFPEMAEDKV